MLTISNITFNPERKKILLEKINTWKNKQGGKISREACKRIIVARLRRFTGFQTVVTVDVNAIVKKDKSASVYFFSNGITFWTQWNKIRYEICREKYTACTMYVHKFIRKYCAKIKSNIRKLRKLRLPLQKKTIAELKQRRNKSNR